VAERHFIQGIQVQGRAAVSGGGDLQIGADAESRLKTYRSRNPAAVELLLAQSWTSTTDVTRAAVYGTTLKKMTYADFDLLEQHGYETAKWDLMLFVLSETARLHLATGS
jgi:NTE family protein